MGGLGGYFQPLHRNCQKLCFDMKIELKLEK